ncbi:MAG: hypothetical protein WCP57_12660 [Bacteroidota bacterium]
MKKEEEIIQSKLNSYRPAFEMQDWNAMEKLLDNKNDRKPIVIWWKYGLAIGLFSMLAMAGIAITVKMNANHQSLPVAIDKSNTTKKVNTTNSAITTKTSNTPISTNQNNLNSSLYNPQNSASNTSSNKVSNSFYNTKNNASSTHSATRKERRVIQEYLPSTIENQLLLNADNAVIATSRKAEYIAFYQQAIASIETTPVFTNQPNKTESFIKNKAKSIPLSYSIGIQGSGLINFSLNKNIVDLYLDQFSDANVLAQLNIGKYMGTYIGLGYADRKTINHHYTTDAFTDITYTSYRVLNNKSIGISIPVGVSANIYQQAYLNVYAKAGINNIVFLKQVSKVEFTNSSTPLVTANNTKQVGNALINSSTDLMAVNSIYTQNTSAVVATNDDKFVHRFTKKSDEKYLAEMNLALGLKANMTKNIAFVFEPSYRLGFKNQYRTEYTHSIALSGAIVLTF